MLSINYTVKQGSVQLTITTETNGRKSQTRNYSHVDGLSKADPMKNKWSTSHQKFMADTPEAGCYNQILDDVLRLGKNVIKTQSPEDATEFKKLLRQAQTAKVEAENKKGMSLGEYLADLIERMRHPEDRCPNSNYQAYITLLHKLQKEGSIVNVPISEVCNKHFKEFGKWIKSPEGLKGVNYDHLMMNFHSTINSHANRTDEVTEQYLTYSYKRDRPTKGRKLTGTARKRITLTDGQLKRFAEWKLSEEKSMLRDFCFLLMHLKTRPADLLSLKSENIINIEGTQLFQYVPHKKKNYTDIDKATVWGVEITDETQAIMNKYIGKTVGGYILPFFKKDYGNITGDEECYHNWYVARKGVLEKVNKFLKEAMVYLGITEGSLTSYCFRHTALTKAVNDGKENIIDISNESGTSVNNVAKTYNDPLRKYRNGESTMAHGMFNNIMSQVG